MGGDADSIAAMAGGIISARFPSTLPERWKSTVKRVNNLRMEEFAEGLVTIRLSKI